MKAFEIRIRKENPGNEAARAAILGFLPRITTVIEQSSIVLLQHTAISCVDQIIEKYGKKDLQAVAAAAEVIVGPAALLHEDDRIRVISLLCLSSCVEVLGAGVIPLLPTALPTALDYLNNNIDRGSLADTLHNAVYAYLGALFIHIPWMITSAHLDRILYLSLASAGGDWPNTTHESRQQTVRLVPKRIDAKDCLGAISRVWPKSKHSGPVVCSSTA